MRLSIPEDINSRSALSAATYFRDQGFPVVPFESAKKRPVIRGWTELKLRDCDDEFLCLWWGNGHAHDIGVLVAAPLVIVDLDGPGDPKVVVEWIRRQPRLAGAPYEITTRGCHLWLSCPDMPVAARDEQRITSSLPGGIGAELFVKARAVRTTPSGLSSGGRYSFAQTGPVPELSWAAMRQIFGIEERAKGAPGRPQRERSNAWKASFAGDLATLDLAKLCSGSKHLIPGKVLDADRGKFSLRCPWDAEHSSPTPEGPAPGSSTVILKPPGQGPVFKCLHANCSSRNLKDLLLWVEEREPGLIDSCCEEKRPLWVGDGDRAPDGRPRILLPNTGRELSEFAAEVGRVVGPQNEWFVREEAVVRVAEIRVGASSRLGFRLITSLYARSAIEKFIQPGLLSKDPETSETVFLPQSATTDAAAALLAAPGFTEPLPVIDRVLEVPIALRLADGSYDLPVEGYDERFQTFLRPGAPKIVLMPVIEALQWLHRVHEGFCLADEQSKVHSLARLITPYVRGIMGFEHRPPVWHYHANRPRAGKDYLAGLAPLIYEGLYTEDAPLGTKSEETSKRLVSALRNGRRTMHFANCQGDLNDEVFIGAVTASVIGGRNLGHNGAEADLQLANEIEFSLSANSGLTFRPDVEPRTRRISLFFAEEDPNNRRFPNPDLHGWVGENRRELLSAVATLVNDWLQAGAPPGPTPFSSFKRWGDVVGGIMVFHELGDPCLAHANDDGCPADRETAAMVALFTLMYEARPESWEQKSEISAVLRDKGGEIDALDLFNGLTEKSDQTRFGQLLRRYVGRELSGITMLNDGARKSQRSKYKFTKAGGGFSASNVGTLVTLGTSGSGSYARELIPEKKINKKGGLINMVGAAAPRGDQGDQGDHPRPLIRRSDLDLVAADCKDAPSLALDLETYGQAKGDGLDPQKGDIRLLTVCREGGPVHILDLRAIGYDLGPLQDVLNRAEIVAHNAKFDLGWLAAKCGIRPAKVFCTCTASRLLGAGTDLRHRLDHVLDRHLGILPGADYSTSDWGDLILTPDQIAYAAADVEPLHRLADTLRSKIVSAGLGEVMDLEMKLLPVVVGMESVGVGVDRSLLQSIRESALTNTKARQAEVRMLLGEPALNLNSPQQLLAALKKVGLNLPNTSEAVLKAAEDDTGVVASLLNHRTAEKLGQQPASLLKAAGADSRIRCSFNPTGTDTGRFSCTAPNLQNIGRGSIRSAFVPKLGNKLIVADYAQIELRIAAAVAGDQKMLAAYRAGADLHRETAAAVLEKPLEEVTKQDRQLAKAVNFGLLYGQGAPGLVRYAAGSYGVNIQEEDAARIRALFFARYKGLSRWHAKAWEKARAKATEIRTRLGRRRLIPPEASEWERFTTLVNTEVQGGAADGMKLALVELAHRLPTGASIISTVHDEVIVEAPAGLADQIRELTQTVMIDLMAGLYPEVPIEVEAHVCRHWGEK